ncbi:hypothetical protein [Thermococcus aciditolerans]|uniref:Uncharacterized protein n=1 Tax=Thermococcus aciditolerans TaxID=2598455 RepID=A0A5C0SNJ6_9EURY|nr:hypothetical protein [Thermococcus aciditolerans]QEK15357.1 hypothetical protein FPV09_09940 [Thermococcus aciditolerans]
MRVPKLFIVLMVAGLLFGSMLAYGEAVEPYVRSPPSDSELLSLNLKVKGWGTMMGNGDASSVADFVFVCRNQGKLNATYHIDLWMGYFTDTNAERSYYEETLADWRSYEDRDEVGNDLDGNPYVATHYRYTVDETGGSSDSKWAVFREVITYECISASCESWVEAHPDESSQLQVTVRYIVREGPYVILAKGWYYDDSSCDVEAALPTLINHYLNTIPGNMVSIPITSGPGAPSGGSENVTTTTTTRPGEAQNSDSGFERPNVVLSPEAKARMEETLGKLEGLSGGNIEVVRIKTPEGELVKVINKGGGAKGTALSFKLKYYGNKYVLDKTVDSSIDALDGLLEKYGVSPLGLFKDYVKAYKDSELFQGEDAVRKTALDLHVDGRSASLYNDMSGIEERELKLSPAKNSIPTGPETKPVEFIVQSLGIAVKKSVAQDYGWEFRKTAERAMYYKKAGMKYRDIIRNTIYDVMEETSQDRKVQTLNAQSKGPYKDQEARIRLYLNKLFEEGRI